MTVYTEGRHAGEFLISEANGQRSRETVTVTSGQNLAAGAIIELATGKAIGFAGATASEAIGVLFDAVDATGGDVTDAVYIARDAEVQASEITVASDDTAETKKTAAIADLLAIGIIAR